MPSSPVSVEVVDSVAVLRWDDGKANAIGFEALDALHAALDRAEKALKRLDDHDGRLDDTAHVAGLRDELNGFFTAVV